MNEQDPRNQLDLLRHVEILTEEVNKMLGQMGKSVFRRYPLTFAILILFGVIAVSEGMKGILKSMGILDSNPWYLFLIGLVLLTFTGSLYKKLNK
ncbi:MAG: hypothetical protein Q7S49_00905 [bacterium]|nr:hypothetical protein [bacterium]